MIDSIYDNIVQAKDYIEKAEVNLVKEKKHQKKSRKVLVLLLRKCVVLSFWDYLYLALLLLPLC